MPKSKKIRKRVLKPDPIYQSQLVAQLINRAMRDGKKTKTQKQVYEAFRLVKEKTKKEPLEVFEAAIENIKPSMEVRSRRVGGAVYQVPMPVKGSRQDSLAIRWLILSARNKPNKEYHHFYEKLAAEILAAFEREGGAIQKREESHRMAEANKAFSHFRW